MREDIANLVHRVFSQGLHLTSRLQQQRQPDLGLLQAENAALHGLLTMAHRARGYPDYEGDPRPPGAAGFPQVPDMPYPPNLFLGIRYALACWVDEVVMATQPWVAEWWNFNKLETKLYPPLNDRHWKFWEQAGLAEIRADIDALEAVYLCVILGFRGKFQDNPKGLREWRAKVEPRLRSTLRGEEPPEPSVRRLTLHKEPLAGYRLYQRMFAAALIVAGGLLFGIAVYIVLNNRF
jgi:type IV/VI secretion system ImpK/VasF family protein